MLHSHRYVILDFGGVREIEAGVLSCDHFLSWKIEKKIIELFDLVMVVFTLTLAFFFVCDRIQGWIE